LRRVNCNAIMKATCFWCAAPRSGDEVPSIGERDARSAGDRVQVQDRTGAGQSRERYELPAGRAQHQRRKHHPSEMGRRTVVDRYR
jgi:hypothetical protein